MSINTILLWLLNFVRFLTGKSSSRIKLDVRSEKAIENERKQLDKLYCKIRSIDDKIKSIIHKIAQAKRHGNTDLERSLNVERDLLLQKFRDAKRDYDNFTGYCD